MERNSNGNDLERSRTKRRDRNAQEGVWSTPERGLQLNIVTAIIHPAVGNVIGMSHVVHVQEYVGSHT